MKYKQGDLIVVRGTSIVPHGPLWHLELGVTPIVVIISLDISVSQKEDTFVSVLISEDRFGWLALGALGLIFVHNDACENATFIPRNDE